MTSTSLQPDTLRAPANVEATPPEAPPIEPRTEAFDWLFVSWRRTDAPPARNAPPRDMRVSDAAELDRTVAQFLARDAAHERYPYIFLAPALAPAFAVRVVAALGDVVTLKDVEALLLPAEHMPGWGIVLMGYPSESYGKLRPGSDERITDALKVHRSPGGAREFVERSAYDGVVAERDELQAELERIEAGAALPARELAICRVLREHVKQGALNWEHDAYKDKVDDWLPSAGELAYWLAKERATLTGDAAPPAPSEPAPDPKLAAQLDSVIYKYFQEKGHGMGRTLLGRKVTARKQNVTANLEWLARPGGSVRIHRHGGRRGDEYLPNEAEE